MRTIVLSGPINTSRINPRSITESPISGSITVSSADRTASSCWLGPATDGAAGAGGAGVAGAALGAAAEAGVPGGVAARAGAAAAESRALVVQATWIWSPLTLTSWRGTGATAGGESTSPVVTSKRAP